MNPVFIFLVLVVVFLIWILGSFLYVKIGSLIYRIVKDAFDEMNKGEVVNENINDVKEKE